MHKALTDFFRAGQNFRRSFSRGRYLVIDPDRKTGESLRAWLEQSGRGCDYSETLWSGERIFSEHPRCIVINADGLFRTELLAHLEYVDREFPEIAEVVYSRDSLLCAKLEGNFPRVTVIRRGEGLDGILCEIQEGFSMTRYAG